MATLRVKENGNWVVSEDPSAKAYADNKIAETVKAGEWRLIQQFTLEEDTVVVIDTDQKGKSFSLKKVKAIIQLPEQTSATQIWLKHNENVAMETKVTNGTASSPSYLIVGEYDINFDDWLYETTISQTYRSAGACYKYPCGHRYVDNKADGRKNKLDINLTSITLALNSSMSTPIPNGAIITIEGVYS